MVPWALAVLMSAWREFFPSCQALFELLAPLWTLRCAQGPPAHSHGGAGDRARPHSRVQADLLEGHQLPRALVASLVHHAIGALPDLLHLLERLLEGLHGLGLLALAGGSWPCFLRGGNEVQEDRKCLLPFPAAQEQLWVGTAPAGRAAWVVGLPDRPQKSPPSPAQGHMLALRLWDALVKAKIEENLCKVAPGVWGKGCTGPREALQLCWCSTWCKGDVVCN